MCNEKNILTDLLTEGDNFTSQITRVETPKIKGIIYIPLPSYTKPNGYDTWMAGVRRFISENYPNELKNLPVASITPDSHSKILGVLKSIEKIPNNDNNKISIKNEIIMGNKIQVGDINGNSGQIAIGEKNIATNNVNNNDEIEKKAFKWQRWEVIVAVIAIIVAIVLWYFSK